ncbi:MAG: methylmalonyl-CoA epimerase [Nitriliruptoraceae bacterium]
MTRIDQIAIAVEDLDETLSFYERAFGLVPRSREVVASDGVEEAMLDVGGISIQLIAPTSQDSPVAKFLARRGPGLHHLGFGVGSLDSAMDHLRDENIALIDDEPRQGGGGHRIAFVHPKGTGGVLIELIDDSSAE